MAHKGKHYPYMLRRDLSLRVPSFLRLPEQFIIDGFEFSGTSAAYMRQPIELGPPSIVGGGGFVAWNFSEVVGTPLRTVQYQVNQVLVPDTRFCLVQIIFNILDFGGIQCSKQEEWTPAMPSHIFGSGFTENQPARLTVDEEGSIFPKPW